jgi:ribose transport system ATP-binding protein
MPAIAEALHVRGLNKLYGGEVALAGAGFTVRRGEIHGLLGANGAGKSTLVRIIAGVEQPDAGTVTIAGQRQPVPFTGAHARAAGLAHIDQQRALAPDLSIADNIGLTVGFPRRFGLIDARRTRRQAEEALRSVGLRTDVRRAVAELPVAEQTLVAIARALAVDATLILLDEPTANLGAAESAVLYERLATLATTGVACLLVTHALNEALDVCHRLTVLRDGQVVTTCDTAQLDERDLARLIVGHDVEAGPRTEVPRQPTTPVLTLEGVRTAGLGPLDLGIGRGEIVGVTGLPDSGHLAIGAVLAGSLALQAGTMCLEGESYTPRSPRDAAARAVAYVPPDRARDGLALDLTCRENLFLHGRSRQEGSRAGDMMQRGNVKATSPEAIISTLSGGNMQKVLLAKALGRSPRLLVLSEPTVGVDVVAREEIYTQIAAAAAQGMAVLVVSSDFSEIAALCHRTLVVRYGQPFALLPREHTTVTRLTELSGASDKVGEIA